jgi:hypothetical protein
MSRSHCPRPKTLKASHCDVPSFVVEIDGRLTR